METEESIEIADLHVRFNACGSTIDAEGEEEEEEIVEDEEVDDRSVQPFDVDSNYGKFFPVIFWRKNLLNFRLLLQMICNFKGACARKKGQGFRPCKAANKYCSTRCRCPHSKCKNKVTNCGRSQILISSFILTREVRSFIMINIAMYFP